MTIVQTRYEHIILNGDGVPSLAVTTMKVVELVTAQTAYGWSAEERHFQLPYLSLGQIHSALAYNRDHREVLDRDISRRFALFEELQRQASTAPLRERDGN